MVFVQVQQQKQELPSIFDVHELERWLREDGCVSIMKTKKQKKNHTNIFNTDNTEIQQQQQQPNITIVPKVSANVVTLHRQRIYRSLYNHIHYDNKKKKSITSTTSQRNNSNGIVIWGDDKDVVIVSDQVKEDNNNSSTSSSNKENSTDNCTNSINDDDNDTKWNIRNVPELRHSVYVKFDSQYFPEQQQEQEESINVNNGTIDTNCVSSKDQQQQQPRLTTSRVVDTKISEHGGKLIIELQDGYQIETVIIRHVQQQQQQPDEEEDDDLPNRIVGGRLTVCVSSQVGCKMGCTFCATGTMRFGKDVTYYEIIEQIYHATIVVAKSSYYNTMMINQRISNIVFMGMGEPLDNYPNVIQAIATIPLIFNHIPTSRITLSTVGIPNAIIQLTNELYPDIQINNKNKNSSNTNLRLALSLHAPNDKIRKKIVPTAKKYPIKEIMNAIHYYQTHNNPKLNIGTTSTSINNDTTISNRCVMIEYIMIDGINSSIQCATELRQLLQNCSCIVNLIPYNPTAAGDRFKYQCPSDDDIIAFQQVLVAQQQDQQEEEENKQQPIQCTVRWSSRRGQTIDAACGQLVLQKQQLQLSDQNNSSNSTSNKNSGTCNNSSSNNNDIEDLGGYGRNNNSVVRGGGATTSIASIVKVNKQQQQQQNRNEKTNDDSNNKNNHNDESKIIDTDTSIVPGLKKSSILLGGLVGIIGTIIIVLSLSRKQRR